MSQPDPNPPRPVVRSEELAALAGRFETQGIPPLLGIRGAAFLYAAFGAVGLAGSARTMKVYLDDVTARTTGGNVEAAGVSSTLEGLDRHDLLAHPVLTKAVAWCAKQVSEVDRASDDREADEVGMVDRSGGAASLPETPASNEERIHREIDEVLDRQPGGLRRPSGRRLSRGLYKWLPRLLADDERLVAAAYGFFTDSVWRGLREDKRGSQRMEAGYLVLTDRRLIALATGGVGVGSRGQQSIPLQTIISLDSTRSVGQGIFGLGAPLRVLTASGERSFRVSPTGVSDLMAAYISAYVTRGPARPTTPGLTPATTRDPPASDRPDAGGTGVDIVEKLGRLEELHRRGALTDEEFSQAKRRLLADP